MSYYDNPHAEFLASQPVRLHFAGWETDTYRLQQAGWKLSAIQGCDPYDYRPTMQVAMEHPEFRIRGLSDRIDRSNEAVSFGGRIAYETRAMLASDFVSQTASLRQSMADFAPIDAEPQFITRSEMMSQHVHFAPNLARTRELIVPEHSVDDLLDMIAAQQSKKREELIRRRIRETGERVDFNPRSHVHAQIISIAG